MATQTFEIEADSIEEARRAAASHIPAGSHLLSEKVVQSNDPIAVRASGESAEAAYARAMAGVPEGAEVVLRKEIAAATRRVIAVEAFNEEEARQEVPPDSIIAGVKLTIAGKGGFLGVGRKPSQYDVEVIEPAFVEIRYRQRLKVAFRAVAPDDPQRTAILKVAETLAGSWPEELPRDAFEGAYDWEQFLAWVSEFGDGIHPGRLTGKVARPVYYDWVDGGAIRGSDGMHDGVIVTGSMRTAAVVNEHLAKIPPDTPAEAYTAEVYRATAYETIKFYSAWTLAKFLFLIPFAARSAEKEQTIETAGHLTIEVYKGIENTLFDVCSDLKPGQLFDDDDVRRKLLAYVERFRR